MAGLGVNRVNSMLNLSRSFGDLMFKNFTPFPNVSSSLSATDAAVAAVPTEDVGPRVEDVIDMVWSKKSQIISRPDITTLKIIPSYEFLILASDGTSLLLPTNRFPLLEQPTRSNTLFLKRFVGQSVFCRCSELCATPTLRTSRCSTGDTGIDFSC